MRRASHSWRILAAAGALMGAVVVAQTAAGSEFPVLSPGRTAVVVGTHITCAATDTTVTCTRAGGYTATIKLPGKVAVAKSTQKPAVSPKPMRLGVNGGFTSLGHDNATPYCHVFLNASVRTLTCSVLGAKATSAPNSQGFNMTDRSLAVFRYDKTDQLHVTKTYQQP